jgi:hypothetical protein
MAKRRPVPPAGQLELTAAAAPAPPVDAPAVDPRPPVILKLGPRDYTLLMYDHDEDGEPVYCVVKEQIKAASTAGVLARKLVKESKR